MSRKFKLHKRCYGEGYDLYKKATIDLEEGLTVLVGCNGSGKTTMLKQLKEQLEAKHIPVLLFNNLIDGGSNAVSSACFYNDFQFAATAVCSSEGENIVMNMGRLASSLRPFIKDGEDIRRKNKMAEAFASLINGSAEDKQDEKVEYPNERWILLDAIDSGLSVDNVVDIKEYLFKTIFADKGDVSIYIVVSANEYEMARGEKCFDVYNGKYITFADYEEYRNFILESKRIKEKRYD